MEVVRNPICKQASYSIWGRTYRYGCVEWRDYFEGSVWTKIRKIFHPRFNEHGNWVVQKNKTKRTFEQETKPTSHKMSMAMVMVGQLVRLGILLPAVNQWCLGQFFIEKYHAELESSYK